MVELPRELAEAIDGLLERAPARELARASADLSAKYRDRRERRAPVARTRAETLAYAATRLPATYAAITSALGAVRALRPDWRPRTMIDLGAGPGTGIWAAATVWPSLECASAIEAEPRMLALGQELARSAAHPAVRDATWRRGNLTEPPPPSETPLTGGGASEGPSDLVLLAYVLGELDPAGRDRAVDLAADAAYPPGDTLDERPGTVVVVEPGTPDGYARVLRARERLLARGGFVTAPCPHNAPCPLPDGDWCHFAARLTRSVAHRSAKQAALGYEDEKFAYVAASGGPTAQAQARVVRHPQTRPRLIELELCARDGLYREILTRSRRDAFRAARKARWGDAFDVPAGDATDSMRAP